MFDVGFTELVLVGVIGLVILGPERLPVAARTVGKWVGKIKRTVGGVQREIQDELRIDEIRKRSSANRDAIKERMKELKEETELMEAPVVAATPNADAAQETEANSIGGVEAAADTEAQPFSEPTSLATATETSVVDTSADDSNSKASS